MLTAQQPAGQRRLSGSWCPPLLLLLLSGFLAAGLGCRSGSTPASRHSCGHRLHGASGPRPYLTLPVGRRLYNVSSTRPLSAPFMDADICLETRVDSRMSGAGRPRCRANAPVCRNRTKAKYIIQKIRTSIGGVAVASTGGRAQR